MSYSGTTSTFSGTIHGALDNTSTISSVTSSYYDPTSSIQTQFNSATSRIGTLETKTTNQSYTSNCTTFTGETQINDEAITVNLAVGKDLLVAGVSNLPNIQSQTINCVGLLSQKTVNYDFKVIGYFINTTFGTTPFGMIPLCKTIQDTTNFCSGTINLQNILLNSVVNLYLLPTYKIVMYDNTGLILFSLDNTTGYDMLFYTVPSSLNVFQIFVYNNNVLIL